MSDYESSTHYKQARQIGRRFLAANSENSAKGYLYVLDDMIKDVEITGEINLGQMEIPINKILGTRTSARSNAFAGNFMPLLPENTEFGAKWIKLYESHIREGIREPIKVFEYINRYFVQEGNKRVSVLRYSGAVSVYAKVTRLIPKRDESNKNISIYYEFLDYDRKASFDNLWFSYVGGFTQLVNLVTNWKKAHPENTSSVTDLINSTFKVFRICFKDSGFTDIPITSGDAYLEFLKIYGFDPSRTISDFRDKVQSCRQQFQLISVTDHSTITTISERQDATKSTLSFFSKLPRKLKVAFAFEGTPENCVWTYDHDIARKRLERTMGEKVTVVSQYNVPGGDDTYAALRTMMEEEPDILFATSPNMTNGVLRLSLEHPDRTILQCDIAQPKKNIMTYFANFFEASFLCGIMAGSMTRSGIIGYMSTRNFRDRQTFNVNAYALGARLVNPTVNVVNLNFYNLDAPERDHISAHRALAKHGVDIALCLHQPNTPLVRKAFPGVYCQLYLLQENTGYPSECIGAAAVDWSVFYNQMVGDSFTSKHSILDITRTGTDSAVHFGWGLNTGILDVLGVDSFMGHNAIRLLNIFKKLISTGQVHPFEGPLFSREHDVVLEKYETLNLLEIQSMTWLHEAIIMDLDEF